MESEVDMELSFAPMEGITGSIYRRVHADFFPGADVYYAPFLAPDGTGRFKGSALRDLLPENNGRITLIPQLLVNAAEPFLAAAETLQDLGYEELNLNVGCPSGTVVVKHKGAGMLGDLESLERCLDTIFSRCPQRISVKTRLGLSSTAEFPAVLALYRRYPLARLIVHARDRAGMYQRRPDLDAFAPALSDSPFPVIYNGNIFSTGDYEAIVFRFPSLSGVMLGRGAVTDPALFRRIRGGPALSAAELSAFHATLLEETLASGLAPNYTVQRMKELWFYMGCLFPGQDKALKTILRSRCLSDYRSAVAALLDRQAPASDAVFNR